MNSTLIIQRIRDNHFLGIYVEWTPNLRQAAEWDSMDDVKAEITWQLQNNPAWKDDVRIVEHPHAGSAQATPSATPGSAGVVPSLDTTSAEGRGR